MKRKKNFYLVCDGQVKRVDPDAFRDQPDAVLVYARTAKDALKIASLYDNDQLSYGNVWWVDQQRVVAAVTR